MGRLRARGCSACGGALIPPAGLAALRQALGDQAIGPPTPAGARPRACPSCLERLVPVALAGQPSEFCLRCDVAWLESVRRLDAVTAALGRRRGGAWPGRRTLVLGGAGALAVALGVLAWSGSRSSALAEAAVAVPPAAGPPRAAAPDPAAVAAARAPTASPAGAEPSPIPPRWLFGGRSASWWEARLELLRGRADEEGRRLYQATRAAAEANGLGVVERSGRLHLTASPALASEISGGEGR
jgi:hypothetical protein